MNKQGNNSNEYCARDLLLSDEEHLINYNKFIIHKFSDYSIKTDLVLDYGAGIGTMSDLWKIKNNNIPECIEIDTLNIEILIKRKYKVYADIEDTHKKYDIIFSINVLEHIKDDLGELKKINSALVSGGKILLFVPAISALYNGLDDSVGHFRRYDLQEIINKLELSNFKILKFEYIDFVGSAIWLIYKIIGSKGFPTNVKIRNNKLAIFDKYIFPISLFLDKYLFKNIIGKNILIIAVKK